MQRTLEEFLRALRANEVRVSPAEAIDAHRAVAEVGYADRGLLRDALCVTLAKSADEVGRFETCFDTFFARAEFARPPTSDELAPGDGGPLADLLAAGDAAGLAQAMEAAAARVGAADIQIDTQRSLMVRRILDDMGLRELETEIHRRRAAQATGDEAQAERLAEGRAALFAEAGRFVDRQARLYASETGRRLRETILAGQRLTATSAEDMASMETLVRKMAKRLATRYARRRHRARRGRLDVRATLRHNTGHGGVPFDIRWKSRKIERPRIAVICDVSRSVAAAAQFLLLFLYCLNEVVERLDAFAFSDRLICVNDVLSEETVDDAIALILARIGYRPTDYGHAFADFMALIGDDIDRRTTVIVLGDGRSNHADPRLDLMRQISDRARAVVWLNPEPVSYWRQGDSRMGDFRRFCHVAKTCNTLTQLERIIEDVLRTYTPR